jgi:hypothetical protein
VGYDARTDRGDSCLSRGSARWREPDLDKPPALILPFELDLGGGHIARMFSTVTALSAPQDVTLQELHIEAFYPADVETESLSLFRQ